MIFFVFFGLIFFKLTGARSRGALPLVGVCWGVTAGKSSHTASNARDVTAGKMGRNSSMYNVLCTFVFYIIRGVIFQSRMDWGSSHDLYLLSIYSETGSY